MKTYLRSISGSSTDILLAWNDELPWCELEEMVTEIMQTIYKEQYEEFCHQCDDAHHPICID